MHAHPYSFKKSRMFISMAALRGMIGGHFGRSNGLPVLTLIVAWFVNYCRHLFGCWNGICVGGEFPVSIWSGGVAIIRWVERGLELKSASVGDNKNIVFFLVTSPLISRLEKKKTKDPHLRMAAIILFTASIPAPIDPRVTGKSLNQWRFCSRFEANTALALPFAANFRPQTSMTSLCTFCSSFVWFQLPLGPPCFHY